MNITPRSTQKANLSDNATTSKASGKPGKRRVAEIEGALREAIASGRFGVGERLPTEPELTKEFHVSRTVLREAVSALRAEGLLQSRQGAGVFVLRSKAETSPLSFLTEANATISDVIEELELRAAVEIEAAGLASERASPAQLAEIQTRHWAFADAAQAGLETSEADAEFHRAIARATNNGRFEAFLVHLGERTIPRVKLKSALGVAFRSSPDPQLNAEHESIVAALIARDHDAARNAMRIHLGGSLKRYSAMIRAPRQ